MFHYCHDTCQEVPMGELARIALIAIVCVGACAIGMLIGKGR